jgi:hypothetical protein
MNIAKRLCTFAIAALLAATVASGQLIQVQSLDPGVPIPAAALTHPTSRVGTSTASATSIVCPAHQPGDALVIAAMVGASTTAPTLPSGFTSVLTQSNATATTLAMRVGYKIATATNDLSGTWTNASELICAVYRPASGYTLVIGQNASGSSTTTTINYPALSPMGDSTSGNSWVVGFVAASNTTQTITTAPSGMSNQASIVGASYQIALQDTAAGVSSWASTNATVTGTGSTVAATIELAIAPATNSLFANNVYQHIGGGGNDFNASNPGNTFKLPFDTVSGAGNTIILFISFDGGATVSSVTGSVNGSLGSPVKTALGGSGKVDTYAYIKQNITAGQETITVTFSANVTIFQYCMTELYGVATTGGSQGSSSVAASTTIGAGSFTPTNNNGTGGNFIEAYFVKSVQAPAALTTALFPGANFTLLNADIGWANAAASVTKAVEGYVQTSSAAINPTIVSAAESTDAWNSIAVSVAISSASGSTRPTGIQINKIDHFTSRAYPASGNYTLQFPTNGNLRACASTDGGLSASTTISDSEGNIWINDGTGIPGASWWYWPNASADPNLRIIITGGGTDTSVSWRCVDIAGAAVSPFDSATASPGQNLNGLSTFTASPSPSATNSTGLTLANIGLGAGPGLAVTAPSGAIWDLALYTGEVDSDAIENADIMAHYHYTATGAQTWTFTITNQTSNNTSGGFILFHQ